jgi:exopolysaccharide biosynthesis polyprenyl glycosylphosphotransferase
MFSRRSRILGVACVLSDSLPTALAFLLAYWIRVAIGHAGFLPNIYPLRVYLPLLLSSLLVFPSLGYVLGTYQDLETRTLRTIASDVVKMSSAGFLVLLTGLFLVQGHYVSRSLLLIFALLHFVFLGVGRWLFFVGNAQLRGRAEHHRNFVIVGTGGGAAALASLVEEGERFGLRLLAFVSIVGDEASPAGLRHLYSVLPLEKLQELLHNHVVDEVVFATEKIEEMVKLEPLMRQCEQEGVRMRIQLDFLPNGFPHVYVEHLAHIPLLTFAGSPPFEEALLVKRAMDFVLASVALIVLSPLFVILAALVALTPGPVFYRQTRCGLGGRRFSLLKFRSMVDNAEDSRFGLEKLNEVDGPVFKMREDPRCTRVGRWMRMFSLDELPQLWNVLCGDMSLVGPRPPLPQEVEQYEPWQRRRLRMRPGLTCLWALEGRSQLRFDRWVKLDLLYIDRWSIWLDCKILFKTIPAVLSGKGAH